MRGKFFLVSLVASITCLAAPAKPTNAKQAVQPQIKATLGDDGRWYSRTCITNEGRCDVSSYHVLDAPCTCPAKDGATKKEIVGRIGG